MNDQRLRTYAIVGLRARLDELAQEIDELAGAFPDVPFAELAAALESMRSALRGARATPPNGAPSRPRAARAKPDKSARRKKIGSPRADSPKGIMMRQKARELLAVLVDHDGGLTPKEIAKKMKLPYHTAYSRIATRSKHGHIKMIDPSRKLWALTAAGRNALKQDRDTV